MKCLKCGADAPFKPGVSNSLCASCLATRPTNKTANILVVATLFLGVPMLITCGVIYGCSKIFSSGSSGSGTVVSVNDTAHATDDIWCMESKEAMDELVDLSAKNAYDKMNHLFLLKGVMTLRKGQSAKVIDESFGGFEVRTSGGQQCWVTSNMLAKGDSSDQGNAPNPAGAAIPAVKRQENASTAYKPAPEEELIGHWQDASEEGGWSYAIVKTKGRFYEDIMIPPKNDPIRHKLKVMDSALGQRYVNIESDTGDYDIIARDGSLRHYDREGYIRTAKRVPE